LQRTLSAPLTFSGTGLHTGHDVEVRLHPAPANHGIVFARVDLDDSPSIPASLDSVVDTVLATTLGVNGATVGTVEHLIAALRGMGVDNVTVDVNGPELPAMDGSARPFVDGIEEVGLEVQPVPRRVLQVLETVEARDDEADRWSRLDPHDGFVIECEISFEHPMLRHQSVRFDGDADLFAAEIAPARTFGMLADVEKMHAAGLALGGSLANALVLSATGVVNPGGLRFPDECVRHKVLDMIGDLALLGAPVLGRFSAGRSGHAFNLALVREAMRRGALIEVELPVTSLTASG